MKDFNLALKRDVDLLRESLHRTLSEDKNNIGKILKVSQELDELIVQYTKQNLWIVA